MIVPSHRDEWRRSRDALGLKSKMVEKFVPIVVDYAKVKGGDTVGSLLNGVLTPKGK